MARTAALLLWAQALGLAGAQPSQLTLDPPWTPAFVGEKVTLTCGGSGAAGPTDWYVNQQLQWRAQPGRVPLSSNRRGSHSYQCRSAGVGLSPPVTLSFSDDWLVLQVPARVLLEGDALPLRCRGWRDTPVTGVQFFREQEVLGGPSWGSELLLSPLQLRHSGRYRCQATVDHLLAGWQESAPVVVAVQELFSVPELRLEGPAEPPEEAPLALGCLSHPSPLRPLARLQHLFYQDEVVVGGPQGSPQLRLPAVGLPHSGNYSCEVRTETESVRKRSAAVAVTVRSECAGEVGVYRGPTSLPGSPRPSPGTSILPWDPAIPPQVLLSLLGVAPSLPRSPRPSCSPPFSPSPPIPAWVPLFLPGSLHPFLAPLSLAGSLHLSLGSPPSPHPSPGPCPCPSPRRGPGLGGVPGGAAPRGEAGGGRPPGAGLLGGRGDGAPLLLLAPAGLCHAAGHGPPLRARRRAAPGRRLLPLHGHQRRHRGRQPAAARHRPGAGGRCRHRDDADGAVGASGREPQPELLGAGGHRAGDLHLAAGRPGAGLGARPVPGGRGAGARRDLPVPGHQPPRCPPRLPGAQPRAGPLGDGAGVAAAGHSRGRGAQRVPPAPARCCPGLAPPAPAPRSR
ncbi:low affinity immunoglobulin gamma Fc region receptor II-a isoform X3 [Opisthocomus hoazin]|uniref:low affinity immunoglobulin gamma Fc region receptor II-a isoform X3 n=1 Tax=Opisthocomus hoazin TaxID=30419 RepID=UPI003F52DEA2